MRELVVLAIAAVLMTSGCTKSGQPPNSASSNTLEAKDTSGPAVSGAPGGNSAMSHVPATVADWAQGAQLFDGLGDFHRSVTTSSVEAQKYFDQGMRLLWAFNHDESTRSFAQAAELDPACAACYWGVALTVGPNYNVPAMVEARARVAWEALHQAQENAAQTSAVEQALIGALTTRYPAPQPPAAADSDAILSAYAAAM